MTEAKFPFPPTPNKTQIDPALLTFAEYRKVANSSGIMHSEGAYDHSLAELNRYASDMSTYPKLLRTVTIRGLRFEIRVAFEKKRYLKFDENDLPLRIDGEEQYFSDDEIKRLGKSAYSWSLGVFEMEDRQRVAGVQDEWGCLLIMVAREYRGFGFGPMLTKIARTIEPSRPSGGFTPAGYHNFRKVHASFVRDALASGLYSKLVRAGTLSIERVREITGSVTVAREKTPGAGQPHLGNADPKDWLLYVGEHGDFVLYDRKVRELIDSDSERESYWIERMILGIVYISGEKHLRLMQFGGVNDKVRTFLMCCAIEFARREGEGFYAEMDEPKLVRPEYASVGPETVKPGFRSHLVTPTGAAFDYDPMGAVERRFRASFDKYGEFGSQVVEMAYAKFRHEPVAEGAGTGRRVGLAEDVKNDVEMRAKCLPAYHAFAAYLAQKPAGDFDVDIGGLNYLSYRGDRIGFGQFGCADVLVLLGLKNPEAVGHSGMFAKFDEPVHNQYKAGLIFDCLSTVDASNARQTVESTGFLKLFEHEFMHLLDDRRTAGRIFGRTDDGRNRKRYMNNPAEFNARFHDVAGLLTDLLRSADEGEGFSDLAEIYGFTGSFWPDLGRMTSGSNEHDFMKWLTVDRRRALLRRLYKLYVAVLDALKKDGWAPAAAKASGHARSGVSSA